MDDVIILVKNYYQKDSYGVDRKIPVMRQVFAKVESVTRAEFYNGGRNGLNPEFKFTVFAADYEGEVVCQYHDKQYSIYRTSHVSSTDYLELYVQREGGTNGESVDRCVPC